MEIEKIRFASKNHRGVFWVNHQLKKGFLCIPKISSSGIREQFKFTEKMRYENIPKDYEIFAIIRRPIQRFISAYIEAIQDCKQFPGGRFKYNLNLNNEKIEHLDKLVNDKNLSDIDKFKKYINLIKNEWGFFEPHCIPQIIYLTNKSNKIHNNLKIFRLENISNLEEYLGNKIKKTNTCENLDLKKILLDYIDKNEDLKKDIQELYKNDVSFYNDNLNK